MKFLKRFTSKNIIEDFYVLVKGNFRTMRVELNGGPLIEMLEQSQWTDKTWLNNDKSQYKVSF